VERRPAVRASAVLVLGLVLLLSIGSSLAQASSHSVSVRDSAKVHVVHSNGNKRSVTGAASGTLPGTLNFSVDVATNTFTVTFVLSVPGGGTISGYGNGTLHIGNGSSASYAGRGSVTGGSGRYRYASGSGSFYGAENRISHAGTIQIFATVRY
jgi:hypothetical protein